jgi:hypothetical protein
VRSQRTIRHKFPHRSTHRDVPRPGVHATRIDPATGRTIYMEDEIVESILGRKLEPGESVRFRNGDSLDCRRENLVLVKYGSSTNF